MGLLISWLILSVAVWVTAAVLPGFKVKDFKSAIIVALIFGLINTIIRPIVLLLSLPLTILTLGLFLFVVNAFMLLITSWIAQGMGLGFRVDGFFPALLGSLIISVVSFVLSRALSKSRADR